MGKGSSSRKVEKRVSGGSSNGGLLSGSKSLNIPAGPVFHPTVEEFKDPLEYIYKIRPEAEPYGICKIVPPASWKPPFALDKNAFTFPTKMQAIHQLQARCASCDPETFALEYNRFLEEHCGKKVRKRVVFEGEELDLCKLFNAVKRFGGYDKVVKMKKWGEVFRFVQPGGKISECSKHVLSLLYLEYLYEYEKQYCSLNEQKNKNHGRNMNDEKKCPVEVEVVKFKKKRKNKDGDKIEVHKVEQESFDQICEQCKSGLHGEVMLLCDRCNKGWHTYCLSPPLKSIPPGNWYCLECVNSEKDSFGFVPGKQFSLEAFRRVAERVKKKWFGSGATSRVQLEKKFWEIVEGSVGEVEVMYGSDLDTSVYGSGFPRQNDEITPAVEDEKWKEYSVSPWNLNNLPRLPGSMLRPVHQNIAGVMVPWLYIGMLFSAFCWHFEDHCFYSMNYHHWGEPKCWYSVPGSEAHAFEKVMRDSLPDLFEVQPDLLFQLVTMLNPAVLQEKGVPVYSIIQEPGNFVITFPRSYHGGFNFGLNCAEAVNFAPADWLPYGGFGAELYRQYHKAAVLSHEELLCVVAERGCDSRMSTYMKKELLRICNNEKIWRERLWRNGIVRSSSMTPRKVPEYVGTEEDPVCVICQQLLYLSAVSCNCRPSEFVCLEHWERLCECNANKLRLYYRHTLSELNDLLLKLDNPKCVEAATDSLKEMFPEKAVVMAKKARGGQVTHLQLAEEWILKSCNIFERPYSRDAYISMIEEAEQFLWAGSEMDLVRDMQSKLIQAQNWAEAARGCLSKLKLWSNNCNSRVKMDHINELLSLSDVPCNVSSYAQLKAYRDEASELIEEIKSALAPSSEFSMANWEILYAKTLDLPIDIKERKKLEHKLSAVKDWMNSVRTCITQKAPFSVEVDILYKLVSDSESFDLKLQLPEFALLKDLIAEVESCRSRCNDILKDSLTLEEVSAFVSEWEDFTVNIPELKLMRKYHSDTVSWISRADDVLLNVYEREDQENVVEELMCIQRDGLSLQIEVGKSRHVEVELEKARCRVKAFKARHDKMSMDFIQQLMLEAKILQIDKEKIFVGVSGMHTAAMHWEEKASQALFTKAQMNEYEDLLRDSEEIVVVLPSLCDIQEAISTAKIWLMKSKPFLSCDSPIVFDPDSCLRIDVLKELVSESKNLKVNLHECSVLDALLNKCVKWEQDASSLLQDMEQLLKIDVGEESVNCLIPRFDFQIHLMESAIKTGTSLGLAFDMIPELQDSCLALQWCIKAISFSTAIPIYKEVEMMLDTAANFSVWHKSSTLLTRLIDGLNWLKKATEILECHNLQRYEKSSVEDILVQSKKICISSPLIIGRLKDALLNHALWLEQVNQFFRLGYEDRSSNTFLQLKEQGSMKAFKCEELDKVLREAEKAQQWKQRCEDIIKPSFSEDNPLLSSLTEIKADLERSFDVYNNYKNSELNSFTQCCSIPTEDHNTVTCSVCKDSFHSQCTNSPFGDKKMFVCLYCDSSKSSKLPLSSPRTGRKYLEADKLAALLADANDLCLWTDERRMLHQVVEKTMACCACLKNCIDFALAYVSEDLDVVIQKMSVALKVMDVAGIYDGQGKKQLERALAVNLWKIRAKGLLENIEKPTMLRIQHQLKSGLAINIPPEDYFRQKLTELKDMGLQWADTANKVSVDGGELELDRVFELISEGEKLPVICEKELKLLRDRSMLYCLCRKPYDQRAMIACDKCDEWYHFDCVNISSAPRIYICPACNPAYEGDQCASVPLPQERFACCKFEEPQTPLRRSELRRSSLKRKSSLVEAVDSVDILRNFSGGRENLLLLWRNRKPFRRTARKRSEFTSILSPVFHVHNGS